MTIATKLNHEWQEWILINLERGCSVDSLLDKLEVNFPREQSVAAINDAQNKLHNPALNRPLIDTSLNTVDFGNHAAQILFTLTNPYIVLIGNVLSHTECDDLVTLSLQKGLNSSAVVDPKSGKFTGHHARTSSGCYFKRSEKPIVALLEQRLSVLSSWPIAQAEGIQVLRYEPGQEYRPHFDWFDTSNVGSAAQLLRGGQRVGTFVVYLSDVQEGGSTVFSNLGIDVRPRKGSALYFSNVDETGRPCPDSLHAGAPVISGIKTIATYWLRERNY